MIKIVAAVIITALLSICVTYTVTAQRKFKRYLPKPIFLQKHANNYGQNPIMYGKLDNFFTGQDSVTYPLIFDTLRDLSDKTAKTVNFGPQTYEGFLISMNVSKVSRNDALASKTDLLDRGWKTEGKKITKNGYIGEVLSSDIKAHPEPNTQTCSFGYSYEIPLTNSNNNLIVSLNISSPSWEFSEGSEPCTLFEDKNYYYYKALIDHVFDNIQPAF